VSGWGFTMEDGNTSSVLKKVATQIVPNDKCQKMYENNTRLVINNGTMCSGNDGNGSCYGDSGGPVVCNRENGLYVLCGIVSGGEGCGRPGFPDVDTRVSYYTDWIKKIVENKTQTAME